MENKVLDIFYHDHPLILTENVSEKESSPNCYGCDKPIANLEMAYVCMEQHCSNRIVLHIKCGELPLQIWHPQHPQHPMELFDFHELSVNWCDICGRDIGVLGYRCSTCDIDVDTCRVDALLLEERKELHHPGHDHPLTLMRKRPFAFDCDGCGAQDVDMAYICSACDFMVHKSCALLPTTLPRDDEFHHHHHHHPLSLLFSRPKKLRKYKYTCDVCDEYVDTTCWVYFCGDCRYFLHLKCVGSTTDSPTNLSEDEDEDGGSDVIEFPLHPNDIYNKLITPFVMRETGLDCIPDAIKDTSTYNHEHPLSLVSKLSHKYQEEDDKSTDVELKICDVCVTPISSPPYYECSASASCSYSIHSICCFLPNTLHPSSPNLYSDCQKIPNKNHNFTLYAPSKSKGRDAISYWKCELCTYYTNGMGYKCEECGMKIDVKCASLPISIKHASHMHHKPLLLTRTPPQVATKKRCHVCNNILKEETAYCGSDDECDFALHLRCAMMPKSIREPEWDKHPLLLTSDASRDHPSDFFCEFCEEEMHPKWWIYHCRKCDVSFHLV